MKSTTSSPNHLARNPYSFCFRMKIPKALKGIISKKELRYSLRTGNLSAAKTKARYLAGKVQMFFKNIQNGSLADMSITTEQINGLLKKLLQDLIQEYDKPATLNWQVYPSRLMVLLSCINSTKVTPINLESIQAERAIGDGIFI